MFTLTREDQRISMPNNPQNLTGDQSKNISDLNPQELEWQEREAALRTLMGSHPANLEALRQFGLLRKEQKRFPEAVSAFGKLLGKKPDDLSAQLSRIECQLEAGDGIAARLFALQAMRSVGQQSENIEFLMALAKCFLGVEDYSASAEACRRVLRLDAGNISATDCLGIASTKLKQKTPATPPPPCRQEPVRPRESKLAHQYLDGLKGLEIGGGAHNAFGLKTRNVDYCADLTTIFKLEEIKRCGEAMKVDLVAPGDELPLPADSEDFVISSHVIEHFFDPIKAIKEWLRVVRPDGYVFIIAPHKERTFDRERARTPLQELLDRHNGKIPRPAADTHEHYSVWITEDLLELSRHLEWNVVAFQDMDDKVGNGFTIVLKKAPKPVGDPD
jgi:SAM-dependent methyltransferase